MRRWLYAIRVRHQTSTSAYVLLKNLNSVEWLSDTLR